MVLVLGSCKMGLMLPFLKVFSFRIEFLLGSRHSVAGLVRSN